MTPLKTQAREGRVNPKGIPCLYLATDRDTAIAEVRPWVGLAVSVGQFKVLRDLAVIDCSVSSNVALYLEEPNAAERERYVWSAIDDAFSRPVNPDDSIADYAPTQILAEVFRSNGLDGIVYKSLLGKGLNIALFDLNAAKLVNCFLFEPRRISFTVEEVGDPYFVRKPKQGRRKQIMKNRMILVR